MAKRRVASRPKTLKPSTPDWQAISSSSSNHDKFLLEMSAEFCADAITFTMTPRFREFVPERDLPSFLERYEQIYRARFGSQHVADLGLVLGAIGKGKEALRHALWIEMGYLRLMAEEMLTRAFSAGLRDWQDGWGDDVQAHAARARLSRLLGAKWVSTETNNARVARMGKLGVKLLRRITAEVAHE